MRQALLGLAAVGVLLAAGDGVSAHMEMKTPPPRKSKFNPHEDYTTIDYTNTAPLAADGSNFPCKNYPSTGNVATLKAGGTLRVELTGGAPHGGGHCQFSVSYDGGRSFGVMKTIVRNCMTGGEGLTPGVPLPAGLPACSSCVFAWTWINAIGNREFYMNCADVEIQSSSGGGGSVTLPALTVANLPGYPTVPEFPNPGDPDGAAIFDHDRTVTFSSSGGAAGASAGAPVAVKSPHVPAAETPEPAAETSEPAAAPAATAAKEAKTAKTKTAKAKATKKKTKSAKGSTTNAKSTAAGAASGSTESTAGSGGGACTPGEMRCSGTGFQFCIQVGNSWVFGSNLACGPGTHCVASGKQITCVAN